jgi:hypothetical protein
VKFSGVSRINPLLHWSLPIVIKTNTRSVDPEFTSEMSPSICYNRTSDSLLVFHLKNQDITTASLFEPILEYIY